MFIVPFNFIINLKTIWRQRRQLQSSRKPIYISYQDSAQTQNNTHYCISLLLFIKGKNSFL